MENNASLNIENYEGFKWWRQLYKKHAIRSVAMVSFFFVMCMAMILCAVFASNDSSLAWVWVLILCFFFALIITPTIHRTMSYYKKPAFCHIGTISDKYTGYERGRMEGNGTPGYRIEAYVGKERFDARCECQTYKAVNKGQQILLFSFNGYTIFAVEPHRSE